MLSGHLKHPAKLQPDTLAALKTSWRDNYQGIDGAHGTPILEEGMEFVPWSVPPEQAQFLETRRFQHNEICRLFRVSPTKAGDLTKSAYNTLEHQSIDHVRSCLRPWAIKIEQECNRKLFTEDEKEQGFYCELNFDALLRGDTASQDNSFAKGIQFGWYSVNDVREYKNLNRIEGGDLYLSPLNMVPAAARVTLDETPPPLKEKNDDPNSDPDAGKPSPDASTE